MVGVILLLIQKWFGHFDRLSSATLRWVRTAVICWPGPLGRAPVLEGMQEEAKPPCVPGAADTAPGFAPGSILAPSRHSTRKTPTGPLHAAASALPSPALGQPQAGLSWPHAHGPLHSRTLSGSVWTLLALILGSWGSGPGCVPRTLLPWARHMGWWGSSHTGLL